jgi:hypothetical protein
MILIDHVLNLLSPLYSRKIMSDPTSPITTAVTPVAPATPKAEAFVLDVIGFLTKLDTATLQNDYNQVVLGVEDLQKIVAALKELDQIKNSL